MPGRIFSLELNFLLLQKVPINPGLGKKNPKYLMSSGIYAYSFASGFLGREIPFS